MLRVYKCLAKAGDWKTVGLYGDKISNKDLSTLNFNFKEKDT